MGLAVLLFLVFMGPVTNPISTEELTGPLGRWLAPVHQVLYLSHGYRFFAPDPGPSHLLVYRLHYPDGRVLERRLPDPQRHWPRLLYHRWFMLSETIFAEHAAQPDRASFERLQTELRAQIDRYRTAGQPQLAQRLEIAHRRQALAFERADRRIEGLVEALAKSLLADSQAQRIELFCQERVIPLPGDVLLGRRLDDPQGLLPPAKIGEYPPPLSEEITPQQGTFE